MIGTAMTLATLALAQPAPAAQDRIHLSAPSDSARCRALVQQALGEPLSATPKGASGRFQREWRPGAHPQAGYYRTLNKVVGGCAVPVPVSLTNSPASKPSASR